MANVLTRLQGNRGALQLAPSPATRTGQDGDGGGRFRRRRPRSDASVELSRQTLAYRLLEGKASPWFRGALDFVLVAIAVAAALALGETSGAALLIPFPFLCVAIMRARGMYRRGLRAPMLDLARPLAGAIATASVLTLAAGFVLAPGGGIDPLVARCWAIATALVGIGRAGISFAQRRLRTRGQISRPTLIMGAGVVGTRVARRLEAQPELGLRPLGFLDANPLPAERLPDRTHPVLGAPEDLGAVAEVTGAEHVVFAFPSERDGRLDPLVRVAQAAGLGVTVVPRMYESMNDRVRVDRLGGLPLLWLDAPSPSGWQFSCKYLVERTLATIALVVLAPLLGAAALAVKLSSPGPVLFRQRRVGLGGEAFDLLKFRSMRMERAPRDSEAGGEFRTDRNGSHAEHLLAPGGVEGSDRRTAIGRWLRRTSIDELPQLWNVARGDMALVGPRPERLEYVEMFEESIHRYGDRHRVKSGLTGLAQAHGLRGQSPIAERAEIDNFYIQNWSFWLDFKILVLTVRAVLRPAEA